MKTFLFLSIYSTIILAFINMSFAVEDKLLLQKANNRFLFQKECSSNRDLVVSNYPKSQKYVVKCEDNYSLYNSKATSQYYNQKKAKKSGKIKILNFNLFYPGQSNTRYKNYKIIASIMNRYDLVSGLELLGSIGSDNKINFNVLKEISQLKTVHKKIEVNSQIISVVSILNKMRVGLKFVNQQIFTLMAVYKKPGYLKLFEELRKLDPSWSLIISAQQNTKKPSNIQELVGFYFKSKKVKLFSNQYCKENYATASGPSYACTPKFSKKFFGKDVSFVFSRRPFMANFESGNFDFTFLASHVVFRTPKKTETVNKILKTTFGLNSIEDLKSSGARIDTYSRFAEVRLTMDLIKKMRKVYSEKDIIFTGDFNLEATNKFWKNPLMKSELKLLVTEKTSLSKKIRFNKDGTIMNNGYSHNYDHFMINADATSECDIKSAKRFDFIKDKKIKKIIDTNYIVRNKDLVAGVLRSIHSNAENIILSRTAELRAKLKKEKKLFYHQIVPRYTQEEEDLIIFNYHTRVFESQMNNNTYYRIYKELISDHAPVEINCSTNKADDDARK